MRRVLKREVEKSFSLVSIVLSQSVISTSAVSEATSHRWLFVCKSKLIKVTLQIQLEYLNQSISRNWRPLVNRAAIQYLHHCTKFYFKPHFPKQINSYNVLLITEHQKETNQISPAQMKQITLDFTGSSTQWAEEQARSRESEKVLRVESMALPRPRNQRLAGHPTPWVPWQKALWRGQNGIRVGNLAQYWLLLFGIIVIARIPSRTLFPALKPI